MKIYYKNVVDITLFEKRNVKTKYFFTKSFIKSHLLLTWSNYYYYYY